MRFIFCSGMFRACSTWQYEVVSHLVEKHRGGVRAGYLDHERFPAFHEPNRDDPRLAVVKAHDANACYAEVIAEGRGVPIYAYRDLRDVAYSYMHKAKIDFDEMLRQRFLERVLENDSFWRSKPNLLSQRYEDLVADPVSGIEAIARHLGIALELGESTIIAAEYSREANLERAREVRRKAIEAGLDLDDRANVFEHDPRTLLHWNHLRENGRSWRDLASPLEREALAGVCGAWLIEFGYEVDLTWAARPESLLRQLRESEQRAARLQDALDKSRTQASRRRGWLDVLRPAG